MELFQLLDDANAQPTVIFEIVTNILLALRAGAAAAAQDAACRYLLNNHVTLVNRMLGLSSSANERRVVLKLLTTFVTLSTTLAKDVLLNVNFNPANVDLLTRNSCEMDDVRGCFIRFLIAFVVGEHHPKLMVLLEKKGLLTSIVKGLQYDDAECVCMVMGTLREHILENGYISKTTKMMTFNTQVVKAIVNLYNWKGKGFVGDAMKKQQKTTAAVSVDVHLFSMLTVVPTVNNIR